MFRRKLKTLGAILALASLLMLHLHVVEHVFGWDHDDDSHGGKAAPCALCQAVLAQVALEASTAVEAPKPVNVLYRDLCADPIPFAGIFVRPVDARGPPGTLPA